MITAQLSPPSIRQNIDNVPVWSLNAQNSGEREQLGHRCHAVDRDHSAAIGEPLLPHPHPVDEGSGVRRLV